MSKSFEVLSETGKDSVLFPNSGPKVKPRQNGNHTGHRPFIAHDEEVKLVQRIFLVSQPSTFRTVVFCGVEQEDGSSLICAHVGTILAGQRNRPVCIVDADFRTYRLHEYFGVSNDKGLTEALLHFDPVQNYVQKLAIANLWLMPCRSVSAAKDRSLDPDRLRERLKELRAQFEYVLINAPAASVLGDAVQLGQLADGVVLVVRANATHRETARKAKENLQSGNVTLLGAVLTNRRFPIPEALYHWL
jgi:polysaccharide biosynthesis transport protein